MKVCISISKNPPLCPQQPAFPNVCRVVRESLNRQEGGIDAERKIKSFRPDNRELIFAVVD